MSQPAPDAPRSEVTPTLETRNPSLQPDASTLPPPPSSVSAEVAVVAPSRYRPTRFHARGGLGEVHVAVDVELRRDVALKQMRPDRADSSASRQRFVLEAEVTGRLEHPGVVPVYGLGAYPDGRPYYAMRFIKGESLQTAIKTFHDADKPGRDAGERSLALRGLLRRFIDVCNAVGYAHSKGVLHRDLKPDNVMLGPFGETLVVDWGLAKLLGQAEEPSPESGVLLPTVRSGTSAETQEGAVVGTVAYMSPEQAEARNHELTPATDVYALGAILYSVLTGQPPIEKGPSTLEMLGRVMGGTFPPPRTVKRDVPPALEAVCLKAMGLQPAERYASAKDLAADVEHWLADEPVEAYREPLPARVRRWGRRHRTLVASAAVLLLSATAALTVATLFINAARDDERKAKEAEQKTNANLTAALARETKLKGDLESANAGLRTALARETKLKGDLEIALKSAAEQRKLALETMADVINVFDARLKNVPGLQDLRKELLDRARKGLEKVARAADTAGQIDHQTVWVHIELGDILLRIDGATQQAKAQYDLARQLAQKLADAYPSNAQAQRDVSASHERLGDVQMQFPGETKAALEAYRASLVIREKLADADPRNAEAQAGLSLAYNKLGDVQLQLGDPKAALKAYRASLPIAQKLVDADPRNAEAQRGLSISHQKLGDVQMQLGDPKAALEAYRASLAIAQELADADPRNAEAQRDLSMSHHKLGDVQMQLGDPKATLEEYRASLAIVQMLADADPRNAQDQHNLSVSYGKLGDVQKKLGDPKAALEAYRASLAIAQKLADADPSNALAQRQLFVSHIELGDVQLQLGDPKAALEAFRASLAIAQKLADADPRNAQAQRDLSVSFFKLGIVAEEQASEFTQAADWYQKALDVAKRFPRPEFFASEVRIFEERLRVCRGAETVLQDASALPKVAAADRPAVLNAVMGAHVRRKQPDKAVAAADLLARNAKEAADVYNAACGCALCVPLADKRVAKERYAGRAVTLLKQAVAMGYKDVAHMKKDADLDALRGRDDFKALLKELTAKLPENPK